MARQKARIPSSKENCKAVFLDWARSSRNFANLNPFCRYCIHNFDIDHLAKMRIKACQFLSGNGGLRRYTATNNTPSRSVLSNCRNEAVSCNLNRCVVSLSCPDSKADSCDHQHQRYQIPYMKFHENSTSIGMAALAAEGSLTRPLAAPI